MIAARVPQRLRGIGAWLWKDGALLRYLAVGAFTSGLDLGLFTLLAAGFALPPVPANVVSTIVMICVSYLINNFWVFRTRKLSFRSFFSFAGITLFTGLLLQSFVIWGLVRLGLAWGFSANAWYLVVVKVCAMGVGAACNYVGYRLLFGGHPGAGERGVGDGGQPS